MIFFSGYEEDVYSVDGPNRLSGVHARLIAEALEPEEKVIQLLLCPVWESKTQPFGLKGIRASHALCLTEGRLLISRDFHQRDMEPLTLGITRDSIVGIEFGEALLMSWLALYVRKRDSILKEGFYFPRHGNHHVAALVRALRRSWRPFQTPATASGTLSTVHVFEKAGYFHERLLRHLLLAKETCWRMAQRKPVWGSRRGWRRWWPVGLAHDGTLLLTDRAFFYVCGRPPLRRKGYVFEHNLLCFSLALPRQVECAKGSLSGVDCAHLVVTFGREGGRTVEILFPAEQTALAQQWAQEMANLVTLP